MAAGLKDDVRFADSTSLGYLRHFPIDVLKLDKSFVDGIGTIESGARPLEQLLAGDGGLGATVVPLLRERKRGTAS